MFDLGDENFRGIVNAVSHVLIVLGDVDVVEGRTVRPSARFCGGGNVEEHLFVAFELFLRQTVVAGAFDVENVGRVFIFFVDENGVVERNAQPAFFVQGGDGFVERFPQFGELFPFRIELSRVLLRLQRERRVQLFEKFRLVQFVGMHFETEIPEPDGIQTFFDDGERRLLFGDEQDALALIETVGDDVRDRLALARSGRTVQDKTFPFGGFRHRGKLRAVRHERHEDIRRSIFVLRLVLKDVALDLQTIVEKGFDKGIFPVFVDVLADVVPHRKAGKREVCEIHLFRNVPAAHVEDLHPDHGEDLGDLQARRDVFQPAYVYLKFPHEKFEKRVIELSLLSRNGDGKPLPPLAFRYLDRNEHERRVFGFRRFVFVPFEKTEREEKHVCARFLFRSLCLFDEIAKNIRHLLFLGIDAQPLVFQLHFEKLRKHPEFGRTAEIVIARDHAAHVARLFEQSKRRSLRQRVIRRVQIGRNDVQDIFFRLEIEQRVFQRQIEKTPLPLFVFGRLAVETQLFESRNVLRRGFRIGVLFGQKLITLYALDFERERQDTRQSAALHVDHGIEIVALQLFGKMFFGNGIIDVPPRKHVLDIEHTDVVDAARNVLLQEHRVVAHAVGKAVIIQPRTATDALFAQRKNGMKPCTFKTGRGKKREFKGCAHAVFENFRDVADGHGIVVIVFRRRFFDGLLFEDRIDRRDDLAYLIFVTFLVPPPFAVDAPLFQNFLRLGKHAQTVGDLGSAKTGKKGCVAPSAAPVIERQNGHFRFLFGDHVFAVRDPKGNIRNGDLRNLRKIQRRNEVVRRDLHRTFERQYVEMFCKRQNEPVRTFDGDVDVLDRLSATVRQKQRQKQRHAVEIIRIADKLLYFEGERNALFYGVFNRFFPSHSRLSSQKTLKIDRYDYTTISLIWQAYAKNKGRSLRTTKPSPFIPASRPFYTEKRPKRLFRTHASFSAAARTRFFAAPARFSTAQQSFIAEP